MIDRRKAGAFQTRRPGTGHARDADSQDTGSRAHARVRNLAAHRAGEQGDFPRHPRIALPRPEPAGAGGADSRRMAYLGEQPARALLRADRSRPQGAQGGDSGLGAAGQRCRTGARDLRRSGMIWWNRMSSGLRTLFSKARHREELDEELRSYLHAAAEEKMRCGVPEAEAWRQARAEMGSIESVKNRVSATGWETWIESAWWDLRYGARQLLRSPGFSSIAMLTLSLGIGANTAVFTLVWGIL